LHEPSQKMLNLSRYYWPVPNSTTFCENIQVEILWKRGNFTAQLKIPCSTENCGQVEILKFYTFTATLHFLTATLHFHGIELGLVISVWFWPARIWVVSGIRRSSSKSGKPGNVREFETCQGNVRDFVNSQGNVSKKVLSWKNVPRPFNNVIYIVLSQEVLAAV